MTTRRARHRRGQAADVGVEIPAEHRDVANRLTRHLSAHFDPAVRARHLHQLRELAAAKTKIVRSRRR